MAYPFCEIAGWHCSSRFTLTKFTLTSPSVNDPCKRNDGRREAIKSRKGGGGNDGRIAK